MTSTTSFKINATVDQLFGSDNLVVTVNLTDQGAIVVKQSGVTVTIAPDQVSLLVLKLTSRRDGMSGL